MNKLVRKFDRWQRRLPLTFEGKVWLVVSLTMFGMGLWRSINLIMLLASFLLVALAFNWRLARRQLRNLKAQRIHEEAFFAGETGSITVEVYNPGPYAAVGFWLRQHGQAEWIAQLDVRQASLWPAEVQFPRRGRQALGSLQARTGFPLGLVDCTRNLLVGEEVIVLPRLGIVQRTTLRRLLQMHSPTVGLARTVPRRHPTAQTDFHGLRSFQAGDSPRWIHWRTSARRGELMVREFEETPSENLIVIVDPYRPADVEGEDEALETTIRVAATICWEWCRQKGDRLVLGLAGREPIVVQGVTSTELAMQMLRALALEAGCAETNVDLLLDRLHVAHLPTAPALLLSSHACTFVNELQQAFHRAIAVVNVGSRDHGEFFCESEASLG